jgi:hypothetical protein
MSFKRFKEIGKVQAEFSIKAVRQSFIDAKDVSPSENLKQRKMILIQVGDNV